MTCEDVSFLNYFIPSILIVCGSVASFEFFKRGYKKGLIYALKSCKQGGPHKWGMWKLYKGNAAFGAKDWSPFKHKRKLRVCPECGTSEDVKDE